MGAGRHTLLLEGALHGREMQGAALNYMMLVREEEELGSSQKVEEGHVSRWKVEEGHVSRWKVEEGHVSRWKVEEGHGSEREVEGERGASPIA
jgi:hypothetical protein